MRGSDQVTESLFIYVDLDEHMIEHHPVSG